MRFNQHNAAALHHEEIIHHLIHRGLGVLFSMVFIVLAVYSEVVPNVSDQEGRVMTALYSILLFAFILR